MAYTTHSYDRLQPADEMKIEREVRYIDSNTDLSRLTALPPERLQFMRDRSAAAERQIYEHLQSQAGQWEHQAAVTMLIDHAIEYVNFPEVKHTSNQWGKDSENSDRQVMSNMVYKMSYHVYENTRYDKDAGQSVPTAWDLTWSVRTNTPNRYSDKIAGQTNKRFTNYADMEKYLAGRIKAYSHLFTEISPPIPTAYADTFRVNGQLLPGYTLEHEEFTPPERAANISGVPVVDEKINELVKESEDMNEPLNIQLLTHEMREKGNNDGAWLKLPATAEQLNAALARIGAQGNEQGKDFFINACEARVKGFDFNLVASTPINELNYLAARLATVDDFDTEKLYALQNTDYALKEIKQFIEYPDNTAVYAFMPDITNTVELGKYNLDVSDLLQMPEAWKGAVDVEKLGMICAANEGGKFCEQGYIFQSGDAWQEVYKGRGDIPQEYRIMPETENPGVEYDTIITRAAAAEPPAQTTEPTARTAPPTQPTEPTKAAAITAAPFVLVSDNPKDKLIEITGKLENGIKGIFESEQYKSYLKTLSKFHNYSLNNCLLIAMQKPDATHVGGFNFWRDDMKRPVKKGEKGIKIIAPSPFKAKKEVDRVDANGKPVIENGKRVKDTVEVTVPAFKVTTVFDASQTEGEPLPTLGVSELTGDVDKYKDFFAALEKTSHVPIGFEEIKTEAKGFYHQMDKRIAINEGMSELQNLKTAIHEIAHARLHAIDTEKPLQGQQTADRRTREVEAESIAYTVCQHYGLDTSDYSFGYVATWSGDKELDTLKSSLDTIRKEAAAIITEVDKHFAELQQDREQTADRQPGFETWSEPATAENAPDNPGVPSDDINAYLPPQKSAALQEAKGNTLWQEYTALTEQHPDSIVFKKVGDFYEVMGDKANTVVAALGGDSHVAGRDVGLPERVPLYGVPAHNFEALVNTLVEKDFKIAVAENDTVNHLSKPAPAIDLKIVAEYMQKQNDTIQAADPEKTQGQAAFNMAVKRLEKANERIPDEHPQLKALITNAAQSPDLPTLKERMQTMNTEFIQHYSTSVQMTIDTSGKAEPPATAPTVKQTDTPPPAKPPAQGENVAKIEAQVKAGEVINLSDLSDAIKKDKAAAQTAPTTGKTGTRTQQQQPLTNTRSKGAAKPDAPEQPSIKQQIAAGKKQLDGQKSAHSKTQTKNKNAGLGED